MSSSGFRSRSAAPFRPPELLGDDGAAAIVIEPLPNGPYLVKNLEALTNSKGVALGTKEVLALCRCGRSTTKPFCSGMHKEIGFDSANQSDGSLDRRVDYQGDGITIHDNRGICAHSGFCTDNLPEVWRLKQEPWIDPHGGGGRGDRRGRTHVPLRCAQLLDRRSRAPRPRERGPAIFVSGNGRTSSPAGSSWWTRRGATAPHASTTPSAAAGSRRTSRSATARTGPPSSTTL
jgi:CDGSH-type Zn-finger protein